MVKKNNLIFCITQDRTFFILMLILFFPPCPNHSGWFIEPYLIMALSSICSRLLATITLEHLAV